MTQLLAALMGLSLMSGSAAQEASSEKNSGGQSTAAKTSPEATGELTDADEILKRADEALKQVKMVSYWCEFRANGWMGQRAPRVSGTVIVAGKQAHIPKEYRLDVTVRLASGDTHSNLTLGSDGNLHYLIDPRIKTAYVSTDPDVGGPRTRAIMIAAVPHFTHPNALYDELRMDLATLLGTTTINGEKCYEVQLQKAEDQGEILWWFSTKDLLPRRRKVVWVNDRFEEAALDWVLSDLKVDPKLEKDPFKFVLPDGYKKTDQQAP